MYVHYMYVGGHKCVPVLLAAVLITPIFVKNPFITCIAWECLLIAYLEVSSRVYISKWVLQYESQFTRPKKKQWKLGEKVLQNFSSSREGPVKSTETRK